MSSTTSTMPERIESPFSSITQEIISLRGKIESARKKADDESNRIGLSFSEETRQIMIRLTCERVLSQLVEVKMQIDAISKLAV